MQKLLAFAIISLLSSISFLQAQNNLKPVPQNVVDLKTSGSGFVKTEVFKDNVRSINRNEEVLKEISEGTLLDLESNFVNTIFAENPTTISLSIPNYQSDPFQLELYQSNIIGTNFRVVGSESGVVSYTNHGITYHGIIKGDYESLVAISIFEDEVRGIISNKNGNYVLGKLQGRNGENTHVLYNDDNMKLPLGDLCAFDQERNTPKGVSLPHESESSSRDVGDCVEIYFEADFDIYNASSNNTTSVTNFINGFFNEVAVLYANESLEIGISEIFIWQSQSPNYNGPSSTDNLCDFDSETPTFNGDLGHLINLDNLGGVAWLNVLCLGNNNYNQTCSTNGYDYKRAYSGVGTSYQSVPTYSWTVNIIAHELGHNFGSNHTQACVWNGNNTAIDGCVASEGTCANGPNPVGGGTIMSYCHTTGFGVNFSNGFGPQPGDVMRARVASANCLPANCAGAVSCNDGIQNGSETGVDCGGTCPPCACPTSLNLTAVENSNTETYEVDVFISSTSVVNNSDITYEAGNYIDLKAGFTTINSVFLAHIVPCTPFTDDGSGNLNLIINQNDENLVAIELFLPTKQKVSISILNPQGEEVFKYIDAEELTAGGQMINLDKRNFQQGLHTLQVTTEMETKIISWEN